MTLAEAYLLLEKYPNLIGKPLGNSYIEYLIISTPEKLNEIVEDYFKYDLPNELALKKRGIYESAELDIFLFPDLNNGIVLYDRIESYVAENNL